MDAREADHDEPITSQPHQIYSIPDLNKIFHFTGIQLFTDIFSKPESMMYTSMHCRRLATMGSMSRSASLEPDSVPIHGCKSRFESCPIPFAVFSSQKHTLRVRLKNGADPTLSCVKVLFKKKQLQCFRSSPLLYIGRHGDVFWRFARIFNSYTSYYTARCN